MEQLDSDRPRLGRKGSVFSFRSGTGMLACVFQGWALSVIASTATLHAQTQPDLSRILERLDRLEQENRALSEEVRDLRARLDGGGPAASIPANLPEGQTATVEQRLNIQERRVDEQAQSKVEASQKFPIRLTGMLLFNAFVNSKQNGGSDYP